MKNILVVGTGYVGLTVGTCFADAGNSVTCFDIDKDKIDKLKSGEIPIFEPGLAEMVKRNVELERLFFSADLLESSIYFQDDTEPDIVILAVGTPQGEDGEADLTYLYRAATNVALRLGEINLDHIVIAIKSTVPVGTNREIRRIFEVHAPKTNAVVVSNPEFLKEGTAIEDFMRPDRVVLGASEEWALDVLANLYAPFTRNGCPILRMSPESAEMAKYAANAMLATRISFMNEIANLCEATAADAESVRKAIGKDSRIGPSFLYPGIGYGGSCFPKDLKALAHLGKTYGHKMDILNAVELVNRRQKSKLVQKAGDVFEHNLVGKRFGVWGLSFKPNTDDIREAPSLYVVSGLVHLGATVTVYDPVVQPIQFEQLISKRLSTEEKCRVLYAKGPYAAIQDADALFIVTEWNEFRSPDFNEMKYVMKSPIIFDGRNLFDLGEMNDRDFDYYSIGR